LNLYEVVEMEVRLRQDPDFPRRFSTA